MFLAFTEPPLMVMLLQEPLWPVSKAAQLLPMSAPLVELAFTEPPLMVMLLQEPLEPPPKPLPMPAPQPLLLNVYIIQINMNCF